MPHAAINKDQESSQIRTDGHHVFDKAPVAANVHVPCMYWPRRKGKGPHSAVVSSKSTQNSAEH